jgi:hypothetical protein
MNRTGKLVIILFLGVVILVSHLALVQAEQKYNPLTGQVENVPTDSMLKYNPFSGTWTYASPSSVLKYNPIQDRWEITKPNAGLRYNIYNNRWEYGETTEFLQYNPFTNQWEYPRDITNQEFHPQRSHQGRKDQGISHRAQRTQRGNFCWRPPNKRLLSLRDKNPANSADLNWSYGIKE